MRTIIFPFSLGFRKCKFLERETEQKNKTEPNLKNVSHYENDYFYSVLSSENLHFLNSKLNKNIKQTLIFKKPHICLMLNLFYLFYGTVEYFST